MNKRDRVGVLVIKDHKLLLVNGYGLAQYWTPGGGIEEGENHEQALKREMLEELGVEIDDPRFYMEMQYVNEVSGREETNNYYFVEVKGEMVPSQEITQYGFFGTEEFARMPHFAGEAAVMARLLADGLIL